MTNRPEEPKKKNAGEEEELAEESLDQAAGGLKYGLTTPRESATAQVLGNMQHEPREHD